MAVVGLLSVPLSRWTGKVDVDRRHTVNWLVSSGTDHDGRDSELVGFGDFNGQESLPDRLNNRATSGFICGAQPVKAAATREKENSQRGKAGSSSADRVMALSPDKSGYHKRLKSTGTRRSSGENG
jgi:hypothetical protein